MSRDELIAVMSAAEEGDEGKLLVSAAWLLHSLAQNGPPIGMVIRVSALVDAGAHESAAIRLVPPGRWYVMGTGRTRADEPIHGAQVLIPDPAPPYACDVVGEGEHATSAALALAIAVLRAAVPG